MMLVALLSLAAQDVSPKPIGSPGEWASNADYPPAALEAEESGTVVFTLIIDRVGKPTACNIDESSGSAVLDKATCDLLLARASFTPAKDRRGRRVDGRFKSRFLWMLPEVETEPMTSWKSTSTVLVGSSGLIKRCDLVRPETVNLVHIIPCENQLGKMIEPGVRQFVEAAGDARPLVVVGELSAQFYSGAIGPLPDAPPGMTRQWLAAFEFDVTEAGKIANCVQTVGVGGPQPNMCSMFTTRFAPTNPPAAHKGRFIVAMSTRAAEAQDLK